MKPAEDRREMSFDKWLHLYRQRRCKKAAGAGWDKRRHTFMCTETRRNVSLPLSLLFDSIVINFVTSFLLNASSTFDWVNDFDDWQNKRQIKKVWYIIELSAELCHDYSSSCSPCFDQLTFEAKPTWVVFPAETRSLSLSLGCCHHHAS